MITRVFDMSAMIWSYEMSLQPMLSADDISGLPFGSVFGRVAGHSVSKRHSHHDGEIFIVLAGRAIVALGDEEREFGPGEAVFLSPFRYHEIRNESDEAFDIVSIYWEHIPAAVEALALLPPRSLLAARTLVFCPPPTPNGGLHLGHLAGPYVRADMMVRGLRSMGKDARYIAGTDDHQSFVHAAAKVRSTSAAQVARSEGDGILATLRGAGVEFDRVTRPGFAPGHPERILALFRRVLASPAVVEEEHETAYCPHCDLSLHQAFACGLCPFCSARSEGEICEACGQPNEARELAGLTCRICGSAASTRAEKALWLDLSAYSDEIRRWLARSQSGTDLRLLVERLLDFPGGPPRYRLTRTTDWGVAWDEIAGQSVDAWVDLALTFLDAAMAEVTAGGPAEITLFLGYDNSFFYAVLLPALACAAGLAEYLPSALITNQFLNLDGEKFSTSRGHAVWADDALTAAGADAVRMALLRNAPEGRQSTISRDSADRFAAEPRYLAVHDWLAGFGGLREEYGGEVPGTGAWTGAHREFYRYLNSVTEQLDGLLVPESFSARGYVRLLDGLVERAAEFRVTEQKLRQVTTLAEEARTSVALEYLAAKAFAALALPVIPDLATRVWSWLGLDGEPVREANWSFLPAGTTCAAPDFRVRSPVPDSPVAAEDA